MARGIAFVIFESIRSADLSRARRLLCGLAILAAWAPTQSFAKDLPTPKLDTVTFAQITDSHIFDDGYKLPSADALRQAADDRDALYWAIDKINRLNDLSPIDFVVFTGDLGLQNVDFSAEPGCRNLSRPPIDPGLPRVTAQWATDETLKELDRLNVRTVFLLPGNNDLVNEDALDTRRFECFLSLLKGLAGAPSQKQTARKALQIETLGPVPVPINGVLFSGLNSASFKKVRNYSGPCGNQSGPNKSILEKTCPDAQFNALLRWNGIGTTYLFTHVPDLIDPYLKTPSWDIGPSERNTWNNLCNTRIAAVFAGHFHSADRVNYGTNIRSLDPRVSGCSAIKTWVAPPLAAKNQPDPNRQARGLLLATVDAKAVRQVQVFWYRDCERPLPTKAHTPQIRFLLWIGIGVILLLFVLLILAARFGWTVTHRDVIAVLVSLLFVCLAAFSIHFARTLLGPVDNSILIALLVLPIILYGVVSGRLTEFSGPGGWGAKFKEVANQPVDTSPGTLKIDELPVQEIEKESLVELQRKIDAGEVQTDRPLAIVLKLGSVYSPDVMREYARTLSRFADVRLFIVKDLSGSVVAYFRPQAFVHYDADMAKLQSFSDKVREGSLAELTKLPGVLTQVIYEDTTNAEALATMDRLGLDAIPVVSKRYGKLLAVADRNRIVSQMLDALAKHK
jgi:hypothetical protein